MRFLILVSALACSENKLSTLNETNANNGVEIEVTPMVLDFGSLNAAAEPEIRGFTISSVGVNPLDVSLVELMGEQPASFTLLTPNLEFTLDPGDSENIQIAFSPVDANEVLAEALIESNAGNEPQVLVSLNGFGEIGALQINPDPLDFGTHYLGCPVDNEVTISNVGNDVVEISEINHLGASFFVDSEHILPLSLAPEEEIVVNMTFTADQEAAVEGELQVVSNEPMGTRIAVQSGAGNLSNAITQEWEFAIDPPSDIMFSVDASCSMSDNTSQLASNFSTFISQLNNYSNDWQVIVTGGDTGCNVGGILTPNTANYSTIFQDAVKCKEFPWNTYFWECDAMGGSYTEALLTEARNAVENTDAGDCNAGFIRQAAMLHIVLVSDEPEQSEFFPNAETWQMLTDQIIAKRGSAGMVRISSIVGDPITATDPEGGCESGGVFGSDAVAGTGYYDATDYTNGVFLSICDNWASSSNLQLLAEASVLLDAYPLDYAAVEDSIEVEVNGYSVNSNYWHYESTTQAVHFDSNPPSEGSSVSITYIPVGLCE